MSEPDPSPAPGRPAPLPPGGYRADAIVVAAGSSSRMGGIDKLEASVGGRPILARAIEAFVRAPSVDRIVVVASRPGHDGRFDHERLGEYLLRREV